MRSFFNSKSAAGAIKASDYEEAKQLDVDPSTFDRATYKRLRSTLTHDQIKDALTRHDGYTIPLEDLEDALANNDGNFENAVNEARSYGDHHLSKATAVHQARVATPEGYPLEDVPEIPTLNDAQFDQIIARLMLHHAVCRNNVHSTHPNSVNYTGTDKNHEWLMSELTKIAPHFKPWMGLTNTEEETEGGGQTRLGPHKYHSFIDQLYDHFQNELVNTVLPLKGEDTTPSIGTGDAKGNVNLGRFVSVQRKLRALDNLAAGQFGTDQFDPTMYEAE